MKKSLMIIAMVMISVSIFAQVYPEATVMDINFVENDSLIYYGGLNTEPVPPLVGDTVIVTGVVMNSPYNSAHPDSGEVLSAGAPAFYLQDTSMTEWSGVLVRDEEASTAFAFLDSGMVVQFKAEVAEYYTTTQINALEFTGANVIGFHERPKPVQLTLDSLFEKGTANPNYLAEKWEGVYVEFKDLVSSEPGVVGSGTFRISDADGTNMVVYNKSYYYRGSFVPPQPGTKIESIRGYIETRTSSQYGWFMINPVLPGDVVYGDVFPPNIYDVVRDKGHVQFSESVTVTAKIIDRDGSIAAAKIIYDVDSVHQPSIVMSTTPGDSIYTGVIPAFNDSVFLSYYIMAEDNEGNGSYNPTDTVTSRYFYRVLDRDLTIQDVQYSPFGSGYSGYHNYSITVGGVVTADTSDIPGDGSSGSQVYIQNGIGEWSGILIFGTQSEATIRGDKVLVTGIVNETYGLTRIGNLDEGVQVTVEQAGVTVPAPTQISSADINGAYNGELPAESYEGVLVKYQNVTVVDENADGNSGPNGDGNGNYGEIYIADGSAIQTRVELQDGGHEYHNFWDASLENEPVRIIEGSTFDELVGIMYYSFSNFKLLPRKNEDFIGYTDVDDDDQLNPEVFALSQNYPNPFNPSTIIQYSLPMSEFVSLKIYDVLGREVKTLVKKEQSAGVYNVEFNASNLTSGVYFYRIETGSFVSVKKLLLLK